MLVYRQRAGERTHFPRPENMPPLLHRLLIERGMASEEEARAFLDAGESALNDPLALSSMAEAVARIRRALREREAVCVYGDYDVDGVAACAILYLHLKSLGADVRAYLPSRHGEGYGLNEGAVRHLAREVRLLITVDCGVNAMELVALAKESGMDVVVTDHHRPGDALPDCPLVNPLLGEYRCPHLCGAGVAWKLVEALSGREAAMEYVDLAALATVADVVPLVGENRAIVKRGLERINGRPRAGMRALADVAGISDRAITAGHLGFQLGPRLNAGGRLGSAERALKLLTTGDTAEAEALARELDAENAERRRVEAEMLAEAEAMLEGFDFPAHRAIVLAGDGWNAGVLGLAAARLVEKYHYPALLLTADGDALKGSCRSIAGVDIFRALSAVGEHILRFGGHSMAAGLTLARGALAPFRAALDAYLWENIPRDVYVPALEYDLPVALSELDACAVASLEALQPTGIGNPAPVLRADGAVEATRAVGRDGAHLKLTLAADGCKLGGVFFGAGARAENLSGAHDALFAPKINAWMGRAQVELEMRALEPLAPRERLSANLPRREALVVRFLTEVLYNSAMDSPRAYLSPRALRARIAADPQGTLLVARDFPQAEFLLEALEGLRLDIFVGSYPSDPRAFDALCVLPAGGAPRNYREIVRAEEIEGMPDAAWLAQLPDRDGLRDIYRAVRALARRPLAFSNLVELGRLVSAGCEVGAIGCAAGLLALNDLHLIELENGGAGLKIPPMEKRDPMDSPMFRWILRMKAEGREVSGRDQ